jgi:hypothetical protein
MPRLFKGERSYNAPPVHFLGRLWGLMVQTVNGRITKIAPHLEFTAKSEANRLAMQTLQYCTEQLGKPSQQKTGLFIWDTTDGNTVLQTGELPVGLAINLFLTSRSQRSLERL